jgi:hypothetical protein
MCVADHTYIVELEGAKTKQIWGTTPPQLGWKLSCIFMKSYKKFCFDGNPFKNNLSLFFFFFFFFLLFFLY